MMTKEGYQQLLNRGSGNYSQGNGKWTQQEIDAWNAKKNGTSSNLGAPAAAAPGQFFGTPTTIFPQYTSGDWANLPPPGPSQFPAPPVQTTPPTTTPPPSSGGNNQWPPPWKPWLSGSGSNNSGNGNWQGNNNWNSGGLLSGGNIPQLPPDLMALIEQWGLFGNGGN